MSGFILLLPDVEGDGQEKSSHVDNLTKDAALRRSGGGVADVRPVQLRVLQGHADHVGQHERDRQHQTSRQRVEI